MQRVLQQLDAHTIHEECVFIWAARPEDHDCPVCGKPQSRALCEDAVKHHILAGGNVNNGDWRGNTSLHFAAQFANEHLAGLPH